MKKKVEIAYHFTTDKLRDGRPVPKAGKWLKHSGEAQMCVSGLHASRTPFQALGYAPGFQLHKVQIEDIIAEIDDKLVARKRKILATIDAKDIILSFARKQALSVVHLFDCPPVLKEWLETGKEDIQKQAQDAANAANAANAAYAANAANAAYAANAVNAAANAAYAAANAANAAANAAAYAANAAANAANAAYAANAAANAAAYAAYAARDDFNKMVYDAFKAQK